MPQHDTVDLMVRDTGCGIPADKLPRIFDRFFTTKSGPDASGKGGTGLGLSFCRDVIEAHHGPDPRRKHRRQGNRLHAQAARRQSSRTGPLAGRM